MVARTILTKRQDAAIERIEEDARKLGGDNPEVVEAAERVRNVRGPDEDHIRIFRTEAIADLMDAIVEAKPKRRKQSKAKDKAEG